MTGITGITGTPVSLVTPVTPVSLVLSSPLVKGRTAIFIFHFLPSTTQKRSSEILELLFFCVGQMVYLSLL